LYLLGRKKEDLENYIMIPERMYDSIYLESVHRAVLKLSAMSIPIFKWFFPDCGGDSMYNQVDTN
jgi:hypothetical protein